MLDQIKKLAETVTPEQVEKLQEKLGEAYPSFDSLMRSSTEDEADERMKEFRSKVKKIPVMTLLGLHRELSDEQQSILKDLL